MSLWDGIPRRPVPLPHNGSFAAGTRFAVSEAPGVGAWQLGRLGPRRFANGAARFFIQQAARQASEKVVGLPPSRHDPVTGYECCDGKKDCRVISPRYVERLVGSGPTHRQ